MSPWDFVEHAFAGFYGNRLEYKLYEMHVSGFITYLESTPLELDADDAAPRTFRTIWRCLADEV